MDIIKRTFSPIAICEKLTPRKENMLQQVSLHANEIIHLRIEKVFIRRFQEFIFHKGKWIQALAEIT